MSLSIKQRVFLIENYFINVKTENPNKECLKAYVREYGKKNIPCRATIKNIVEIRIVYVTKYKCTKYVY